MNISNKNNKTDHSSIKSCLLLLFSVLVAVMMFLFLGCTLPDIQSTDTTQAEVNTQETDEERQNTDATEPTESTPKDTVEDAATEVESEEGNIDSDAGEGEVAINVYYTDTTGEYLIGETRIIPEANKFVEAVYEMLKEPTDSNLIRLIPDTTRINDIAVEDGLAKVDLSTNFVDDRFISDVVDILLVYSVVNTLTEFDEVDSVEFYIDGERLDLIGQLDLVDPLFRRSDLIKKD